MLLLKALVMFFEDSKYLCYIYGALHVFCILYLGEKNLFSVCIVDTLEMTRT